MINSLKQDLTNLKNPKKAKILQGFFKTKKGEYGEGDIFLGVIVPNQRKVAQKYPNLKLNQIQTLLNSNIHEHRLTSLFILINQYKNNKEQIANFYLKNTKNINNWDLVDSSAPKILGNYLLNKDKSILYKLAKSKNLWERRISIISTLEFIKNNQFNHTIELSKILLKDNHDLIQKAVGWMLREMGKRDIKLLQNFLNNYHKQMPRTMLRYAIEKLNKDKRVYYLKK